MASYRLFSMLYECGLQLWSSRCGTHDCRDFQRVFKMKDRDETKRESGKCHAFYARPICQEARRRDSHRGDAVRVCIE